MNNKMRNLFAFCVSALLSVALSLPVGAQQSVSPGGTDEPCTSAEEAAFSLPVTAVVSKVDLYTGRATLETSVGKLELATTQAGLQALQTGDVLTLCVDPTALSGSDNAAPASRG